MWSSPFYWCCTNPGTLMRKWEDHEALYACQTWKGNNALYECESIILINIVLAHLHSHEVSIYFSSSSSKELNFWLTCKYKWCIIKHKQNVKMPIKILLHINWNLRNTTKSSIKCLRQHLKWSFFKVRGRFVVLIEFEK